MIIFDRSGPTQTCRRQQARKSCLSQYFHAASGPCHHGPGLAFTSAIKTVTATPGSNSSLPRHPGKLFPEMSETPISYLSLIHISEPTRQAESSYAVFCLKKKK